jgi:hypothetical protein
MAGFGCWELLWAAYVAETEVALQRIGMSKWWVTGRATDGSEKHYLLRAPQAEE